MFVAAQGCGSPTESAADTDATSTGASSSVSTANPSETATTAASQGGTTSVEGTSGSTGSDETTGSGGSTGDAIFECLDASTFDLPGLREATGPRPFTPPAVSGTTREAGTLAEFNAAMAASVEGDGVRIVGGPHAWGVLTVATQGVTIFDGTLTGDTAFDVQGSGNTFHSIRFENMTYNPSPAVDSFLSSAVMYFKDGADGNRVLNCQWDTIGGGGAQFAIITTAAHDLEVADCDVRNVPKNSFGFAVNGGTVGGGTGYHLHHNSFQGGAEYSESQGGTPLRLGLLANDTQAVVEYNIVLDWANDNETIENKGSNSIIRFNYLADNGPDSFLSNRVGHNNVVYANYVGDASLGIYDNGSDNVYVYNYFVRHTAPMFGNIAVSLFAQTPGNRPTNPAEPGCKDAQIQRNVFSGFDLWLATVQQFGEVITGPTGVQMHDNLFLGTEGVGTQMGYVPDGGRVDVPFEVWDGQNVAENHVVTSSRDEVYCVQDALDLGPIVIAGVRYERPFWWAQGVD